MIQTISVAPGVTLRYCPDTRFKQGRLSLLLVRPMRRQEAAMNALLPAVLLRGSRQHPDLRAITRRLDELYGAAVGATVRRIGDYQTTGLQCGFIEDRFALAGDRVLEPMADFLRQLLLEPALEDGAFRRDFVEGEKKNLIAAIESERNDKRLYAEAQLLRKLCREDSFGIPRLGDKEDVQAITAQGLYAHYRRILEESPAEVFYVGSAPARQVAGLVERLFASIERKPISLPPQTALRPAQPGNYTEQLDIAQGKLCMGFTTGVTCRDEDHAAMRLLNVIFGAGTTSKLFTQIREKQSLCYDIGSAYYGSKGMLVVNAGIDFDRKDQVAQQVLQQLELCRRGEISREELTAAKEALLSSLRTLYDSPGSIDNYFTTGILAGGPGAPEEYMQQIRSATREQVAQAAHKVQLHSTYFLEGVQV